MANRAYQIIADVAFGLVHGLLRGGEAKYADNTLADLIGPQRRDHLPHMVRHAVKAALQAGMTLAEIEWHLELARLEYPLETDEDHLAAVVSRATMESMRQGGVDIYTAQGDDWDE